jgi:hypothetical protein
VIGAGISYAWFRPGALPQTLESVVSLGTWCLSLLSLYPFWRR